MRYKTSFVIVLLLLVLTVPTSSFAQTPTAAERARILAQIELLLQQILHLQSLLLAQQSQVQGISTSNSQYPESKFYSGPYTGLYNVVHGELQSRSYMPNAHRKFWQYFTQVIGESAADTYIGAFRVYSDEDSPYDAFVETADGTDWAFSVNEYYVDVTTTKGEVRATELFIHEYAHILIYNRTKLLSDFEDIFWTQRDYEQSRLVAKESTYTDINDLTESYYAKNQDRFVSDYATINPEEDFAETFLYFVEHARLPDTDTIAGQKVSFLTRDATLLKIREQIRKNVGY